MIQASLSDLTKTASPVSYELKSIPLPSNYDSLYCAHEHDNRLVMRQESKDVGNDSECDSNNDGIEPGIGKYSNHKDG